MNNISSLSNPVYEAMSCGKCVIALDRGDTRKLIKDGENGIVIKSYVELKDAITSLISNPDRIGVGSPEDHLYMAFLGRKSENRNSTDKQST